MIFFVALLIHIGAIATLFPEIAVKTSEAFDVIVAIQFPLMALAAVAHSIWGDEDDALRSRFARLSLTFGITYVCILIFAIFGVSIGPADPFGAPESSSLGVRAGWFVGFSLIASIGSRFFIATSILDIAKSMAQSMRRSPTLWYGVALCIGLAMGVGSVLLLHSEAVSTFVREAQAKMDENPAPYVIGFIVIPLILGGVARSVRK